MTKQQLFEQITQKNSYLCVGLDTDIKKIPLHLLKEKDPIFEFNRQIIDATVDFAVAYKPNIAFYEALGAKGWESLQRTVEYIPKECFTIADAKRGDIGNTSGLYARTFFDKSSSGLDFDSVTVAPYMGSDSVMPFLEFEGKWVILLALTSNAGGDDFQNLQVHNTQSSVHSPQSSVHNTQSSVHSPQSSVHNTQSSVHSPQSSVHSPQSSVHNTQSSVHSPQSSVDSPQSSVHSPQSSVDSPQPSVHSPQSSVHSSQSLAHNLQQQITSDQYPVKSLYEQVILTSQKWADSERMMYVVGATKADKLLKIRELAPEHFLLVPGVGAQGGSLDEVSKYGMNKKCGLLVNSSRAIIYASSGEDFAQVAAKEAKKVQQEMKKYLEMYL
jgi:orotidine 5'-phosphate decarboxylase subfamily 2